jgi:hypothetical protein
MTNPQHQRPDPTASSLSRADILLALWRGSRNGAFLGIGVATSLALLPWMASALIRWTGGGSQTNLGPVAIVAIMIITVLAAATLAVLTRVLLPPFGPVAWGLAWLLAAMAIVAGTPDRPAHEHMLDDWGRWPMLVLVCCPLAAVFSDWWSRTHGRLQDEAQASGKIPSDKALILKGLLPITHNVVMHLPVLLLVAGVLAGHLAGVAVGRLAFSSDTAPLVTDVANLIGRVIGALAGALLAVALLRLYRVETGSWPGEGDRPYPRGLAALYVAATVASAAVWLLSGRY